MSFQNILGEDRALEILRAIAKSRKISHAYLFLGPGGVGKFTAALEFVKLLNCDNAGDDCCDNCPSCVKIDKLQHPDVYILAKQESARGISIKAVRALQQRLFLKPFQAQWKIAIIKRADEMSEEAANCLLKILEEPSAQTLFILTSSRLNALPATIVSRCQVLRFKALSRSEVSDILQQKFSVAKDEARFLSAISNGNISRAMSLKGEDAIDHKNSIIDAFCTRGTLDGFGSADIAGKKKDSIMDAMDILLGFYRDVMLYKYMGISDLMINIDRKQEIAALSDKLDGDSIQACIENIQRTKDALWSNANTKLSLRILEEKLTI